MLESYLVDGCSLESRINQNAWVCSVINPCVHGWPRVNLIRTDTYRVYIPKLHLLCHNVTHPA
jgi:hypothetical protein